MESSEGSRLRNLLRHVISPGRTSLTELPGALERWEEQVSKYKNSKDQQGRNRDIPEDILMAALESLVPTDLEVHLQMNSARFDTYDAMRVEVLAYIESRTGSRMTETKVQKHDKTRDDAMDVDSVVKGKGKNKFSGECYHCGKVGHKVAECWSRDRISNKGSGKNSSANVAFSSKGKSKGKSQGKGKSKRPVGSLEFEEESWKETDETESEEWWNSWGEDAKPSRDEAPSWGHCSGRHGVGAELIQNCIWGNLARRGPIDVALFLTGWSLMSASRACHGCPQTSDLSGQGAGQGQSGHLSFWWRLDPLLALPHWDLDFPSNDEGSKADTDGRAHQVV